MANLLGVAGTDVPIEEIDRLTLPYKVKRLNILKFLFKNLVEIIGTHFQLGVNGYSFIVSNNGYLLLHPELRPVVSVFVYFENMKITTFNR